MLTGLLSPLVMAMAPRRAAAYVRGLVPPRPALWIAAAMISALMVCSVIPVYVGGLAALVAFVLGVTSGVGSALAGVGWSFKVLTGLLSGLAAAAGVAATDNAGWAAGAVVLFGLVQAPLNARAASLGFFLPVLVSVFATIDVGDDPRLAFGWVVLGFGVIHWLAGLFNLPKTEQPLALAVAVRHAVVFAVAAGVIQLVLMRWGTPHGYWLVLTLASVLRPVAAESRSVAVERSIGTVAGVLIAIVIVWTVPQAIALLLTIPCAALMIAWAVMQDLRKQTMFGTPVVVLMGSAGAISMGAGVALERLVLTALGVVIAAGAVVVLEYLERRTA